MTEKKIVDEGNVPYEVSCHVKWIVVAVERGERNARAYRGANEDVAGE